ncbi:MAG: M48 family metallopeptidase [Candidatus Woesearchaeota archaeon]
MIEIEDFKKEVNFWANKLNIKPKEIHVRSMHRKYASCSTKGRLTFSFEILNKSKNFRSKVIVHELLHLRYKTHNRLFNSILNAYLSKENIDAKSIKI